MKPYKIHNGLDLRTLDGVKVYRVTWILMPQHAFCKAENVIIRIINENKIFLDSDNIEHREWFKECHNNEVLNEEIQWIETYDETL